MSHPGHTFCFSTFSSRSSIFLTVSTVMPMIRSRHTDDAFILFMADVLYLLIKTIANTAHKPKATLCSKVLFVSTKTTMFAISVFVMPSGKALITGVIIVMTLPIRPINTALLSNHVCDFPLSHLLNSLRCFPINIFPSSFV